MKKKIITLVFALVMVLSLPVQALAADFTDVSEKHWAYKDITSIVEMELMKGTSETKFEPDSSVTRAMFVTILGRMHEMDGGKIEDKNDTFTDTKSGSYYSKYVAWGVENELVTGTSKTEFNPNGKVTREQVSAFLYRYSKMQEYVDKEPSQDVLKDFADNAKVSSWAKESMAYCVSNEYIKGMDGSKLNPTGASTRAQAATIFNRYIDDNLELDE